jgi:hypothetical protein
VPINLIGPLLPNLAAKAEIQLSDGVNLPSLCLQGNGGNTLPAHYSYIDNAPTDNNFRVKQVILIEKNLRKRCC